MAKSGFSYSPFMGEQVTMTPSAAAKISVIIPAYNTGSYIQQCIASILSSSAAIEVIVIDDGSSDNTVAILTELAASDSRLQVVCQPNQGPSAARNNGLRLAQGEYIMFVDSDDYLNANAIDSLVGKITASEPDLLVFDAEVTHDVECDIAFDYQWKISEPSKGDLSLATQDFLSMVVSSGRFFVSPWLYVVRHSILSENKLKFPTGIFYEDETFTPLLFSVTQRVMITPTPYYIRRVRAGSTMTTANKDRIIKGYSAAVKSLTLAAHSRGNDDPISKFLRWKASSQLSALMNLIRALPQPKKLSAALHLSLSCIGILPKLSPWNRRRILLLPFS